MDELFKKRRSVRRFQDRPVAAEVLADLFETARYSPSWGNLQCWELVVVEDGEDKRKLAGMLSAKNPAGKCTESAPVLLAVCGSPQKSGYYKGVQVTRYQHWFLYDLGIISQTLCLKAWELGLGSVIIGSFDHKAAEELLGVPEGVELVALIALGYPDRTRLPRNAAKSVNSFTSGAFPPAEVAHHTSAAAAAEPHAAVPCAAAVLSLVPSLSPLLRARSFSRLGELTTGVRTFGKFFAEIAACNPLPGSRERAVREAAYAARNAAAAHP